jgi:hypothetical protein
MDPTSSLTKELSHLSVGDRNVPPEAAFLDTSSQLTRVSCERDVFTNNDHKIYDAKIMNTFNLHWKHDEEPDLPALLSINTLGDKRLVTLMPDDDGSLPPSSTTMNNVHLLSPRFNPMVIPTHLRSPWLIPRNSETKTHRRRRFSQCPRHIALTDTKQIPMSWWIFIR